MCWVSGITCIIEIFAGETLQMSWREGRRAPIIFSAALTIVLEGLTAGQDALTVAAQGCQARYLGVY